MSEPAAPGDEYDCLVGPLLTLVQSEASTEEITHYLRTEIVEHFGLSGEGYDFPAVAECVRRWFDQLGLPAEAQAFGARENAK